MICAFNMWSVSMGKDTEKFLIKYLYCAGSQGHAWALCYSSFRGDCTSCPSTTYNAAGGSCSCPAGAATFHGGCDGHATTLVLGNNSLGCALALVLTRHCRVGVYIALQCWPNRASGRDAMTHRA